MSTHPSIQTVDENGNFIELAKGPNEARAARQIRAISRVTLTDKSGKKFLLQKRAERMKTMPGLWDHSAAGHVDEGETPEQAAYRELKEEIGISETDLKFEKEMFFEHPIEADGTQSRMYNYFYSGVFDGELNDLVLDPNEVSEARWFTRGEIIKMLKWAPDTVTDGIAMLFGDISDRN